MSPIAASGKRIYLDNSAVTAIDPEVLGVLLPYFDSGYGNPSSIHGSGRRSRQAIEKARGEIAEILEVRPDEIIFTGSGTEADNLALIGIARANKARGNHIIVSTVEHKAILEAVQVLKGEGFIVTFLPVNERGLIDVDTCLKGITEQTILISVMYVNNEIGTVEPIQTLAQELAKRRRDRFPLLHTDACQASNLFPLTVGALGVDLMTVNGSKIYGPSGVGFLYKKAEVKIAPLIVGGEQEKNLRAGTESVPFIVGLAAALRKAQRLRKTEYERLRQLRKYFIAGLKAALPNIIINGDAIRQTPAIVHVTVPFIEGESMLLKLDHFGIDVSTGSACSAFDLRPSHVLLAIGQHPDLVHGSIRFSMGRHTTQEELDYVVSVFPGIVHELTHLSALTRTV